MTRILLTGFEPFDGRMNNASWIAARLSCAASEQAPGMQLRAIELPVCWGSPRQRLETLATQWQPQCVIGMGEGEKGVFKVETVAHRLRRSRLDNQGQPPPSHDIDSTGPAIRSASADCYSLHSALLAEGIPTALSTDAGGFLCEELLYTLEGFRETHSFLTTVVFVHVPPYGTPLTYRRQQQRCDEPLLLDFGRTLLKYVADSAGHNALQGKPVLPDLGR